MWKKGIFGIFTKYSFNAILTLLSIQLCIIIFIFTKLNDLSWVLKYHAMRAYCWHYHLERVDDKRWPFDGSIMVDFKQSSWENSKDKNIIEGNLQYVGNIVEINELDYQSFKCCNFKCRWYESFERTQRHDTHNRIFSIDSSKCI